MDTAAAQGNALDGFGRPVMLCPGNSFDEATYGESAKVVYGAVARGFVASEVGEWSGDLPEQVVGEVQGKRVVSPVFLRARSLRLAHSARRYREPLDPGSGPEFTRHHPITNAQPTVRDAKFPTLRFSPRSCLCLSLPRFARKEPDQPLGHRPRRFLRPPLEARPKQRAHVGIELRIADLARKVSLEHRARHRSARAVHVLPERRRDPARIAPLVGEPRRQIEQIPALAALVERSQLRCQ